MDTLTRFRSGYIQSKRSKQHLTLLRLCPLNSVGMVVEGQGRGEDPLIATIQLGGQPVLMSSLQPPPTLLGTFCCPYFDSFGVENS